MSGFEMKPVDEAQFDAFLQGRDDLSRLLRQLPQPKASAELDAAILAMVSADLKQPANPVSDELNFAEVQPSQNSIFSRPAEADAKAANEAVFDPARPRSPGFIQRWRMPLGLAASALFALAALLWQGRHDKPPEIVLAQAKMEQTYPQAAAVAPAAQRAAEDVAAAPPLANPAVDPAVSANAAKAAAVQPASESKKSVQLDTPDARAASAGSVLAMQSAPPPVTRALKPAPAEIATASPPMASAKAAPEPGILAGRETEAGARPSAAAPDTQLADARAQAAAAATPQAPPVQITGSAIRRPLAEAEKGLLARSEASDEARAYQSRKTAAAGADKAVQADNGALAMRAPAPAPAARAALPAAPMADSAPQEQAARAKAWASLVEELLKANMQQEALEEWVKFRKAYPQYKVSERLQEQIKVLQAK